LTAPILRSKPRPIRTGDYARDGSFTVLSYGDYFSSYRDHPERKALALDGKPCHRWTGRLLQPRHLEAVAVPKVAKESNRPADEPPTGR
jgi:hypothetical protein